MNLYTEGMTVRLKTEYIKEHNLDMYPERWNVEFVVIKTNEVDPDNRYGICWQVVSGLEWLKKRPLCLVIHQVKQRGSDGEILPFTRLMANPDVCIFDDEFWDGLKSLKIYDYMYFGIDYNSLFPGMIDHIREVCEGNLEWWEDHYDKRIQDEKDDFKKITGFEFDDIDREKYYKLVEGSVEKFIKRINKDFEKKTGEKLSIEQDCHFGEFVTIKPGWNSGRLNKVERFWEKYIRHNEVASGNIRNLELWDGTEWKKFDLTKYFKNGERYSLPANQ